MRSPKLRAWITKPESSALFVNGNQDLTSKLYSTSFVSTKLVNSIQTTRAATREKGQVTLVISYFCAKHSLPKDSIGRPTGMMGSLIAQLLYGYPRFDHDVNKYLQVMDYDDIHDLCNVFELLIDRLPHGKVVFCIIDAIAFYEESKRKREDAKIAVKKLAELADRRTIEACVFKLLLTGPGNSRVLYRCMQTQKDVLWMEDRVERTAGFTNAEWRACLG